VSTTIATATTGSPGRTCATTAASGPTATCGASLEAANAAGVRTGGLKPIAVHPVLQKVEQALELILAGDLDKASGPLASGIKVTEAFLNALRAVERKVEPALGEEWRARAEAIRDDLVAAAGSTVPPAP
jgi:hypothetical protein